MPHPKNFNAIYIAHPDFLQDLCDELGEISAVIGNLVFSSLIKPNICFALDVWLNPKITHFESISEAVKILRAAGKFWAINPIENIRRSQLIAAELRKLPEIIYQFPLPQDIPPIGCFSLLDKNTLVYSTQRFKKPPTGYYSFIEDKINPPNRAYLKLWEALTLWGELPKRGESAIDLGASPGGWTYVMASLGVTITAVDKATLDPNIAKLTNVKFLQQSAFALEPSSLTNPVDWLLCDVACYPERTYELITQWIAAKKARKMIFTIKLQGKTDFEMLAKFQDIPNARVLHLFYNKHEVTFFWPAPGALKTNLENE